MNYSYPTFTAPRLEVLFLVLAVRNGATQDRTRYPSKHCVRKAVTKDARENIISQCIEIHLIIVNQ